MNDCPYALEEIYSKIDTAEIISFDIFDTLIKRNFSEPKDIFFQVQQIYNNTHDQKIIDYVEQRIEAQKKARLAHIKDDYTFEELYNFLQYEDFIKSELKNIEIEVELNACVANEWMKNVYDYCLSNNKTIVIVSDMYLDESIVSKILNKNGFNNYKKLYVSSKYRLRKRNGLLFKKVLSDFYIKPQKFLHIGDSYKSDYLFARKNGMQAVHIPTKVNNLNYYCNKVPNSLEENFFLNFLNNKITSQRSREEKIGFEIFAPLLYGYIHWLKEKFLEKDLKNIFFCSRDMYLVYSFFDKYLPDFLSHYFYISRKSIRGAYLYKYPTLENINDIISVKKMSMKQFLKNINVNENNVKTVLQNCDLDLSISIDLASPTTNFRNFVEKIKKEIVSSNKEKYDLFLKYLKQINFQGEVALVDSGWNATSQYCLSKIIEDVNINGFYVGLEYKAYERINPSLLHGYLFSLNKNVQLIPFVNSFKQVLESVLSGTQQSVIGYQLNEENKVIPVLDNTSVEMPVFALDVQKGIMSFLQNALESNLSLFCSEQFLFYGIYNVSTNPDLKDVKILTNFQINNLEINSYNYPTNSVIFYLFHPKFFFKEFKQAPWKVGYLKALLKIKLPYYKMYRFLKKMTKR